MMKVFKRAVKALIRTPGPRHLVEGGIILSYISRNSASRRQALLKTPWACEFHDFNIGRTLDYNDGVFQDYHRHTGFSEDDFRGKRILEIGPGENLGVAIEFLMRGASQVVCVDRFQSLRSDEDQSALYSRMRERLSDSRKPEFDRILKADANGRPSFDPERLRYVSNTPLELLEPVLGGERFDFVLSRAVLEHLYDLDAAMGIMDRLLLPGGVMIHEVDFRDHGMFTLLGLNPLTHLTIPDSLWRRMTSHLGAPNRCLTDFFEKRLEGLGYQWRILIKFLVGSGEREINKTSLRAGTDFGEENLRLIRAIRPRLQPAYRELPDEKLLPSAIFLTAKKPG